MAQIEQYLIFGRAARSGSFRAAAEALGVSNSHVSKHIARLEQSLGYKLFHRSPRLALTEAGHALLPEVESLLGANDQLTHMAPALKDDPAGVVRIALPPLIARQLVLPKLPEFLARYPEIKLELTLQQSTLQAFSDQLDLVVTLGALPDSSLVCRRIGECETVLVATPEYLRARGTPETPAELKQHDCLASHYPNFDNTMSWALIDKREENAEPERVDVDVRVATNDTYAISELVAGHMGIGVLLRFSVEQELRRGTLVPVLDDYRFPVRPPVYLVYHDRELLPESVKIFKEFLVSVIAEGVKVLSTRSGQN